MPATAKALRSFRWCHNLPRHCNVTASSKKSASSSPQEDHWPLSSQPAKAGTGPRPRPPCRSPTQGRPDPPPYSPKPGRTAGHLPDSRRDALKRAPDPAPPDLDEGLKGIRAPMAARLRPTAREQSGWRPARPDPPQPPPATGTPDLQQRGRSSQGSDEGTERRGAERG